MGRSIVYYVSAGNFPCTEKYQGPYQYTSKRFDSGYGSMASDFLVVNLSRVRLWIYSRFFRTIITGLPSLWVRNGHKNRGINAKAVLLQCASLDKKKPLGIMQKPCCYGAQASRKKQIMGRVLVLMQKLCCLQCASLDKKKKIKSLAWYYAKAVLLRCASLERKSK